MAEDTNPNADPTQLLDITDSGTPVPRRIADGAQAGVICNRLIQNDIIRARRRLAVQGQYNGNPPKPPAAMTAAGRAGDSNLNWKQAKAHTINAWTPYFDLICEVPKCIDGDLNWFGPDVDADLMSGFSEFFHDMVFGWDDFDEMNQLRDLQMLLHGVGTLVWMDEWTWFPEPILASNTYLPDETLVSMRNGEELMITKNFTAGELYKAIADPKLAEAAGWKVDAVRGSIMNSASAAAIQAYGKVWDRWEQVFKNGDLYLTQTQTKQIPLAKIFVQEMSGKISEMLINQNPGGTVYDNSDFLYFGYEKYADWTQVTCMFPYDIGADATYHSIKGLGTDIFPYCEMLNKVYNGLADLIVTGIKPMFQPQTGGDLEKWAMVKWGAGNLIPQGFNPVDTKMGNNLGPALEITREFSSSLDFATGAYAQQDIGAPTVEETAKAASIRAAERAKLTKGAFNRFMRSVDRQYREMFRRASNSELRNHHPNSRAPLLFQAQCKRLCQQMGVDWQVTVDKENAIFSPTGKAGVFTVLQMVQNVRATRALGLGSPAMRMEIAGNLMQNIDRFDEIGQNEIKRFYVASMTGYHTVDAIVPSLANQRDRVNDESLAAQEDNGFTILGPEAEAFVVPGQNHVVHLSIHIPSMQNDMQGCQQGQQDIRECAKRLEGKGPHAYQHLAALKSNPTKKQQYQQFYAQYAEIAAFQNHLEQMINEQNQQQAQQPQPGQPDPEMVKVQGKLQLQDTAQKHRFALMEQKQQFEQGLKINQATTDNRIKDLTAAASVQRNNVVAVAKVKRAPATKTP